MRKVFGTLLYVLAGFLCYLLCLLSFINEPPASKKWAIIGGFAIPTLLALVGGMALHRWNNWRMHAGLVFLAASGFTTFIILTFACMYRTPELQPMIRPDAVAFFGDYGTGGAATVSLAIVGLLFIVAAKHKHPDVPL